METVFDKPLDKEVASLNDHIANMFAFEEHQPTTQTSIPANNQTEVSVDISKTGYTPVMVTMVSPWNTGLVDAGIIIDGNTAKCNVRNETSSAVNARPKVRVMYQKA